MIRSQLNAYSGADPIWGFVALIGSERYTGEAAVGIDPRVRLFAVDGRVYFAEREGDAPVGTRLVNCGAVSTAQLNNGSVQIGETCSLARLFQREPSIDRDAVELTIDLATESLLESVANKAVGMPEVFPLRHHSSGVHHWLRSAATSSTSATLALPVVEEVHAVEAAVAVESTVSTVEEAFAVEELFTFGDAPDAEEASPVGHTPAIEEVRSVHETPVVEHRFIMEEVFALEALSPVEAVVEEPVATEEIAEEPTTSSFIALTAMSLPTLSSMTDPAADDLVARNLTAERVVADDLPTPEPMLAPMATLASLTLPTLQSASASAPESFDDATPTLASTSDDFFSSLTEPEPLTPAHPYEPSALPTGLPKLASAPISMSDLAIANAVPAAPFGEPTHNLAAVDIWEMVDVLTDDGHTGKQQLVGSGGSEKQGRSWFRARKG